MALFVPYFPASPVSSREVNLTFNGLIRDRKAVYISMGEALYSSGKEKGIVYTNFYDSPSWSNNAVSILGRDLACLTHLTDTEMIRWCGKIEGARAMHLRTENYRIPDQEVEKALRKISIRQVERAILEVDHPLTVAFDMDNQQIYTFPFEKRGRVFSI